MTENQGVVDSASEPAHFAGPILAITDARFRYRDREVLHGVSLSLNGGEIVVLLGPNGAGKSTLVKAIAGRLDLETGSVTIAGGDPRRDPRARRASGIVPQNIALFEKLTAFENLVAFGKLMGLRRREARTHADRLLTQFGLASRRDDRVSQLSGGMRRRINIAVALMHAPRVLVLDEPTVGIDVEAREELAALLRRLRDAGLAILLTTHDLDEAESLADRVAIMVAGRLLAVGPVATVIAQVFGESREVTLGLAGNAPPATRAALRQTFADGGFSALDGGQRWRAVVNEEEAASGELVQLALSSPQIIDDVRVRRPGLAAVLRHYGVERAGRI